MTANLTDLVERVGLAIWRGYFCHLEPSSIDADWPKHCLREDCLRAAREALSPIEHLAAMVGEREATMPEIVARLRERLGPDGQQAMREIDAALATPTPAQAMSREAVARELLAAAYMEKGEVNSPYHNRGLEIAEGAAADRGLEPIALRAIDRALASQEQDDV